MHKMRVDWGEEPTLTLDFIDFVTGTPLQLPVLYVVGFQSNRKFFQHVKMAKWYIFCFRVGCQRCRLTTYHWAAVDSNCRVVTRHISYFLFCQNNLTIWLLHVYYRGNSFCPFLERGRVHIAKMVLTQACVLQVPSIINGSAHAGILPEQARSQ